MKRRGNAVFNSRAAKLVLLGKSQHGNEDDTSPSISGATTQKESQSKGPPLSFGGISCKSFYKPSSDLPSRPKAQVPFIPASQASKNARTTFHRSSSARQQTSKKCGHASKLQTPVRSHCSSPIMPSSMENTAESPCPGEVNLLDCAEFFRSASFNHSGNNDNNHRRSSFERVKMKLFTEIPQEVQTPASIQPLSNSSNSVIQCKPPEALELVSSHETPDPASSEEFCAPRKKSIATQSANASQHSRTPVSGSSLSRVSSPTDSQGARRCLESSFKNLSCQNSSIAVLPDVVKSLSYDALEQHPGHETPDPSSLLLSAPHKKKSFAKPPANETQHLDTCTPDAVNSLSLAPSSNNSLAARKSLESSFNLSSQNRISFAVKSSSMESDTNNNSVLEMGDFVEPGSVILPLQDIQLNDQIIEPMMDGSELECVGPDGSRTILLGSANNVLPFESLNSEEQSSAFDFPSLTVDSIDPGIQNNLSPSTLSVQEQIHDDVHLIASLPDPHSPREEAEPNSTGSRKRMRNEANWKKVKAKQMQDKGEEHISVRGKLVRARRMAQGCGLTCRLKCESKITEEERKTIFENFWRLGNHTRQWDFIKGNTVVSEPAVHSVEHGHKRMVSRQYFFEVKKQKEKIKVCRTMFLNTLDISETWCRTAQKKLDSSGVTISPDKRGRHSKVKKSVQELNEKNVTAHINLFPRVSSHFCRAQSKRQYLDSALSIKKMYTLYKDWMKTTNPSDPVVSEKKYRDVFCQKFNLSFFKPKKDQCQMCSAYRLATESEKRKLQEKYNEHISNKKTSREHKEADKNCAKSDQTVCCAIFDLEKVLQVPKCESSVLYYKRKLSVYNFSVYDVVRRKGFCYMWSESEAGRGANEIASCVLKFIEMMVEQGVKEFRLWSDNCSAQNKNKHLFSMYTHASAKYGVKISHKYLESGHTQNECDSLHANVERASRSEEVFSVSKWFSIVENAKQEGHPYDVIKMKGDVLNFHLLSDLQSWSNRKDAKWKEVREIEVRPEQPTKVYLKHKHDQAAFKEIDVMKHGRGRPLNLKTFRLVSAYDGPLEIKKNKIKDLHEMCNTLVIPSNFHHEFLSLHGFPALTNPILEEDPDDIEVAVDDCSWGDENDNLSAHEQMLEEILEREIN